MSTIPLLRRTCHLCIRNQSTLTAASHTDMVFMLKDSKNAFRVSFESDNYPWFIQIFDLTQSACNARGLKRSLQLSTLLIAPGINAKVVTMRRKGAMTHSWRLKVTTENVHMYVQRAEVPFEARTFDRCPHLRRQQGRSI